MKFLQSSVVTVFKLVLCSPFEVAFEKLPSFSMLIEKSNQFQVLLYCPLWIVYVRSQVPDVMLTQLFGCSIWNKLKNYLESKSLFLSMRAFPFRIIFWFKCFPLASKRPWLRAKFSDIDCNTSFYFCLEVFQQSVPNYNHIFESMRLGFCLIFGSSTSWSFLYHIWWDLVQLNSIWWLRNPFSILIKKVIFLFKPQMRNL